MRINKICLAMLRSKFLWLFFLLILIIVCLIGAGARQHPIVIAVGMVPTSHDVISRGFFSTRKIVYSKEVSGDRLYEKIVKRIESSDFMHEMNTQKIIEKSVSDFTARSLGLAEGGDYEFTLLSSNDFYCYIINRRDDVYIVIRE